MCLMIILGGENFVALDLIVQHVHSQLEKVRANNRLLSPIPLPIDPNLKACTYLCTWRRLFGSHHAQFFCMTPIPWFMIWARSFS